MSRSATRPILLTNARVVDPSRGLDQPGDVLIADGVIKEAGKNIRAAGIPEGAEIVECNGHVVAPGLVDMRAFIGEPGAEHRETLAAASPPSSASPIRIRRSTTRPPSITSCAARAIRRSSTSCRWRPSPRASKARR
jgi:dihydroorotase